MLPAGAQHLLVGEIRDEETAESDQAASPATSSLDAPHERRARRLTRLIDMGVEAVLVASSIQAAMGQALIRSSAPLQGSRPRSRSTARPRSTSARTCGAASYRGRRLRLVQGSGTGGRKGIFSSWR